MVQVKTQTTAQKCETTALLQAWTVVDYRHQEKARQLSFFKGVSIEVVKHCGHAFSLLSINLSARIWIRSMSLTWFKSMGSRQYHNVLSGIV